MAKSLILEDVLLRLKKYVEEQEIQVTVTPTNIWTRFCLCFENSKEHCEHGNILPDKGTAIIVKIAIRDWEQAKCSLFWRECLVGGEPLFLPFDSWNSEKRREKVLKTLFAFRKQYLRDYRREKLEFLRDRVSALEKENKALSLLTEKYSLLLQELYAPEGTLAKDAMEHFSSLK